MYLAQKMDAFHFLVMAQLDSLEPLDQGEKAWIVDGNDQRLRFDPGELPIP